MSSKKYGNDYGFYDSDENTTELIMDSAMKINASNRIELTKSFNKNKSAILLHKKECSERVL